MLSSWHYLAQCILLWWSAAPPATNYTTLQHQGLKGIATLSSWHYLAQCILLRLSGVRPKPFAKDQWKLRLSLIFITGTLQHTATHCNTPQHTATHCNTPQHTAIHCNTLQHTATHCNTLQHTATHCNTLQHKHAAISPLVSN